VGMPMPLTTIAIFDPETLEEKSYGEMGEVCMIGPGKMLEYSGYMGKEMTERTLVPHADGETWLHTGDIGYISEHGIVYILGRGYTERFGGGYLFMMRMESKVVQAPGVKDAFFCFVPDQDHEGYFVPYMYVILDEGKTLEEVKPGIFAALEKHEYPAEITVIKERPYFHFKTNRKELTAAIVARLAEEKAAGNGKMKITWTQNNKATGYEICYSTDEAFSNSKTLRVESSNTLQEVIKGLSKGMRYFVKIRAYNTYGNTTYYSAWSSVESIVHATVELANVSSGIEVNWTKVKGATEYRVFRKKVGDNSYMKIATVKELTSFVDTTVKNGLRYYYYVAPQVPGTKSTTNVAAQMYLRAPEIEKLLNN
ncbi:MAG: AMP-binding protein, partial [Tyzzerella sp.]|nr:AMP-binding protein [Tyzzerella sp.]